MSLLSDLRQLFFPAVCYGCMAHRLSSDQYFCLRCQSDCPVTDYHLHAQNPSMDRVAGRAMYGHGSSMFHFYPEGKVQNMIHMIKYRGHWRAAQILGRHYGDLLQMQSAYGHPLIIPVPLHVSRLKIRGYNQSMHFARGISERTGWHIASDVLARVTDSPSQTALTREERITNIMGAFATRRPEAIAGHDVLIVDDILTTGATLEACFLTLQPYLDRRVSFATIGLASS